MATRAEQILLLINQRCDVPLAAGEDTSRVGIHWVPQGELEWIEDEQCFIRVNGGGDASTVRAFERRGLIRRIPTTHGYCITEDGRIAAERILEVS